MNWLFTGMMAVTAIVTYFAWIRPLLRSRPAFSAFYAEEESLFAALKAKFAGLKQKLTTALIFIAGIVVTMYDQIAPYVYGVDFTNLSDKIPPWAWPLIMMAITALLGYFRKLGDRGE